jgi:hypothetical protein
LKLQLPKALQEAYTRAHTEQGRFIRKVPNKPYNLAEPTTKLIVGVWALIAGLALPLVVIWLSH